MTEFYYYVWGLYGLAALVLFYLLWRMCRHITTPFVAPALRALFAALLLTPARVMPEQADLAPALMLALFDGMAEGWPGAWHGLKYILLAYAALLLLLLLGFGLKRALPSRKPQHRAKDS